MSERIDNFGRPGTVYAPVKGRAIEIKKSSDPVFSMRILGDGVLMEPEEGKVYAPFDGRIGVIADTGHAIGLISNDGAELLIHVGTDTSRLAGEGFFPKVSEGEDFKRGDLLLEFDLERLLSEGYDAAIPVIITNLSELSELRCIEGPARAGKTVIIEYKIRENVS